MHQCKHAIFLNSGTSALQVALAVLKEKYGYQDGDEVLVPALTFVATANVVLQNNLRPVFVDVDPITYNMDPEDLYYKITSRSRAIIPAHLFGLPADMEWINRSAKQKHLQVLEDSCETMAATIEGTSVGSWGDMAAFSTYVAHLLVGGIGGFITTNDDELARMSRSSMAHGRDSIYMNIDQDDNLDEKSRKNMIERRFNFERIGYSYRATELEAAIALSELERLDGNIFKRQCNARYLTAELKDLDCFLNLPVIPFGFDHSFMVFPIVLRLDQDREEFLMHLERNGIETRYMLPLLSQPIYKKLFPGEEAKHPVAQRLAQQGCFIGIHQGLGIEDLDYISEIIHDYFEEI
jgi:CDP-6-deoxy-D-xylo-4-hexulose-3-dehydrase